MGGNPLDNPLVLLVGDTPLGNPLARPEVGTLLRAAGRGRVLPLLEGFGDRLAGPGDILLGRARRGVAPLLAEGREVCLELGSLEELLRLAANASGLRDPFRTGVQDSVVGSADLLLALAYALDKVLD